MKPGDKDNADTGENRGLRLTCDATGVKTFFYRYTSPLTHKLTQIKIGHFPNVTLAQARSKLQDLKQIKNEGHCPAIKAEKQQKHQVELAAQQTAFTVRVLVELYLTRALKTGMGKMAKFFPAQERKLGKTLSIVF
ncbi:Arm DNA-binding domain-containing protein [Yersinia aldovae]|uniref:Arm DNA-binding domain-containing protein n=1 Tax=Yersinia aldovae TaxID=29483 RepID=UPI0011A8ADDC|nr:Arm DNA-binding domain-containing protein [Yersinia aldovae]